MSNNKYILAIESAVGGGSIALCHSAGDAVVRSDGNDAARAEKIMTVIAGILDEARITLRDLGAIAVSNGPGSYSGIRIGMATAFGLANAASIPVVGISVLEAMALSCTATTSLIAAVPVGKNDVAWQTFDMPEGNRSRRTARAPEAASLAVFVSELSSRAGTTLFVHSDLLVRVEGHLPDAVVLTDAGKGLAEYVGQSAMMEACPGGPPRPMYLRNKDVVVRPGAF